jgi:hypothetical protein
MTSLTRTTSLLTLLLLLAACSSGPSFKEAEPAGEFADQGLYPVRATGFREVHARRDARLSRYRAVNIEALELDNLQITASAGGGTLGQEWQMTPAREQNLRQAWAGAMERAFPDYARAGTGGEMVRITAELVRVDRGRSSFTGTTAGGAPAAGSADSADIYAEFRLYDQAAGTLLAVIRDDRTIPALQWSRSAGIGITNLFNAWASLLHTRISGS